MNCALLALLALASLVSSGEDDYDPCKAGWFLVNFVSFFKILSPVLSKQLRHGTARYISLLLTPSTLFSIVLAALVNGDIAITKYELLRMKRTRRAATALVSRLWKHGIIPYEIDDVFTGMMFHVYF
jgi:hypothetical protein